MKIVLAILLVFSIPIALQYSHEKHEYQRIKLAEKLWLDHVMKCRKKNCHLESISFYRTGYFTFKP